MARCMNTAAATRTADQNRAAYTQVQQDQIKQQQQQQDAANRARDDAQAQRDRGEFQKNYKALSDQADAFGKGGSNNDGDATNPPTASQIPDMVCEGSGDNAICDAR